jgi:hypothetical protein
MSNDLASIAATLRDIAYRANERACTSCRAGVPGLCRNPDACLRTIDDGQYLQRVADCLTLT